MLTSPIPGPRSSLGIETRSPVADLQVHVIARSPQAYIDLADAAVLRGVLKRFLENAIQAQRRLRRQLGGDIVGVKRDAHLILFTDLLAEHFHGRREAEHIEFRPVQIVRQRMDIRRNFRNPRLKVDGFALALRRALSSNIKRARR